MSWKECILAGVAASLMLDWLVPGLSFAQSLVVCATIGSITGFTVGLVRVLWTTRKESPRK